MSACPRCAAHRPRAQLIGSILMTLGMILAFGHEASSAVMGATSPLPAYPVLGSILLGAGIVIAHNDPFAKGADHGEKPKT